MSFLTHRRKAFRAFNGFGNASRSFDGVNDYIDMGDVLDSVFAGTGKQFTVAAWVKTTAFDNGIFLGKYVTTGNQRQMFFRVTDTGELACLLYSTGNTTPLYGRRTDTNTLTTGAWHHVAITYDQTATGDYLRMWIDGTEDASLVDYFSSGSFTSIYDSTAPLQIGSVLNGTSAQWGGNLADIRIYDTDIPDSAIVGLSNGTDYQTNLVGWWLDDDDDVLDNAGSNDGTNNGSTYSTDGPAD